jgi:preprotein translocase subunit SecG
MAPCRRIGPLAAPVLYWLAMLYYLLVTLYVLVCFLLLVVVLLQQGKGGDIAAAFGGASSQTAFGARAGANFLTRSTTVLGTLFMLGALGLGIASRTGAGGSVVSGVGGPAAAPTPAAPVLPTAPMASPTPTTTPPAATPTTSPAPTTTPTTSPAAGRGRGRGGEDQKTPDAKAPGKTGRQS